MEYQIKQLSFINRKNGFLKIKGLLETTTLDSENYSKLFGFVRIKRIIRKKNLDSLGI